MKIIFFGTPEFSLPSLFSLSKATEIIKVVTQPDRPKGRRRKLSPPPVKVEAERLGISVLQPEKIKNAEFVKSINELSPDAIVVVAYGKILPSEILGIPRFGCINLHASILPKYRGAAPVNWAIINGERITGVTTMRMDEGMDTGDILLQKEIEIEIEDTVKTLSMKLSHAGADLLVETLKGIGSGSIIPQRQDESKATYAPMLKKEDGRIDWRKSALKIHNQIRGMNPWPGAYSYIEGKKVNIWKSQISNLKSQISLNAGLIQAIDREGIHVITGDGIIVFKELQPESRVRMSTEAFVNGYRIKEGMRFT